MGEVAAETVEFPDREHVAFPQGAQSAVESRPAGVYAGSEVVVEVGCNVDTLDPQRVALQVQQLGAIRLRDAGVAGSACIANLRLRYMGDGAFLPARPCVLSHV